MAAIDKEQGSALINEGLERLAAALRRGTSEQLVQYLEVMSRFHHYSFRNLMLIMMQREDATRVAGFGKWKQLGRHVTKGEQAIGILAPMRVRKSKMKPENGEEQELGALLGFKMVRVFDISQTEGDDLPEFAKAEGEPGDNLARISRLITNSGNQLIEAPLMNGANGSCDDELGTITYRPGLTTAERFRVLVHEFAHHRLRHCERKCELPTVVREIEAEAIAFVVCHALGIDSKTRSSDYIQMHRGDATLLGESLDCIQKTAASILNALESVELGEQQAEATAVRETQEASTSAPAPARCNHTLLLDVAGSTWTGTECEGGTRYSCSACGKFYGVTPKATRGASPEPSLEAAEVVAEEPDEEGERRIGRADYEERRNDRIERFEERAANARQDSEATFERAQQMADIIPLGQPILVGHHSETRDRNYRTRIQNTFRKGCELTAKAKHYEERAASAESNHAISSDDPEAVVKLREKLAKLERYQAYMKQINAAWRKAGKPKSANIEGWAIVATHMGVAAERLEPTRKAMAGTEHYSGQDAAPCAPYQLSNNNAQIRRVKKRIEELLEEGRVVESSDVDHGVCRVVENADINRIQLIFDGKPSEAVRAIVKQQGFRWARTEVAWQRQLNNAGRSAAKYVVEQLQAMEGETADEGHDDAARAGSA